MSLSMWWKEGKNQSHVWAVQPGRTIFTLLLLAAGTWEDGWYLGTGPECGEEDVALPHLPLSSLPPLPLSGRQPSYLFAAITACSACCVGSSGSRNCRISGVFASSWYPPHGCRVHIFLALPWLWPYHLSTQGKEVGLHCAGDECPGRIWPRVQETCRVPLAGRSSVSCPLVSSVWIRFKKCLKNCQPAIDSMMHFPVVRL